MNQGLKNSALHEFLLIFRALPIKLLKTADFRGVKLELGSELHGNKTQWKMRSVGFCSFGVKAGARHLTTNFMAF